MKLLWSLYIKTYLKRTCWKKLFTLRLEFFLSFHFDEFIVRFQWPVAWVIKTNNKMSKKTFKLEVEYIFSAISRYVSSKNSKRIQPTMYICWETLLLKEKANIGSTQGLKTFEVNHFSMSQLLTSDFPKMHCCHSILYLLMMLKMSEWIRTESQHLTKLNQYKNETKIKETIQRIIMDSLKG